MTERVVVVGGGLAGMAAAARLAKARYAVTLYERSDRLGGRWAARSLLDGVLVDDGAGGARLSGTLARPVPQERPAAGGRAEPDRH